jgi:hypothetical protein
MVLETFEKCSILPAQLNLFLLFNRGSRSRQAKILTTVIHGVFLGLRFEPIINPEHRGRRDWVKGGVFQRSLLGYPPMCSVFLENRKLELEGEKVRK